MVLDWSLSPWKVFDLEHLVKVPEWSSILIFWSSSNVIWSRNSSENLWKIFDFKSFRRSSNVLWYQRPSEGPWMIFDLEYLPNVFIDVGSRFSKDPRTIFDLEEFPKIFGLSLTSKNFPRSLNDLRSWRTLGVPWMTFDLEDLPKIFQWNLISKLFRRFLNDLDYLNILEQYFIEEFSEIFKLSLT